VGAPGHAELACGAVAPDGIQVWNEDVVRALGLSHKELDYLVEREQLEVARRESAIRTPLTPAIPLNNASVVLVDDGVATGATMRAAMLAVLRHHPAELVVALPVGPSDTCEELQSAGQCSLECLNVIDSSAFASVGEWYDEFSQVETEECRELLIANREQQQTNRAHPGQYH
jgi:putative phosphoribosyl transferase